MAIKGGDLTPPEDMVEIEVALYGRLRDLSPAEPVKVLAPRGLKVRDLRKLIAARIGVPEAQILDCAFSTQEDILSEDAPVENCREMLLLPPVSGG
ncbi:MAG: hypothetical protein A3G41_07845 [Elusimicrobia bacterium RIFCSPLOWO2_12_FULL_59_9]|nr:MAG: hypothetical protein A3G41_07845 [Elusimicrobia bacterium RIFCSPLOWO2_12_FULL_59_9]